jgi:hypothetical protein
MYAMNEFLGNIFKEKKDKMLNEKVKSKINKA